MSMLRSGATDGEGAARRAGVHATSVSSGAAQSDPYFGRHAITAWARPYHKPVAKAFRFATKAVGRSIQKAAAECAQLPNHGRHADEYRCHAEPDLRSFAVPV
jgi:hypothetical protein